MIELEEDQPDLSWLKSLINENQTEDRSNQYYAEALLRHLRQSLGLDLPSWYDADDDEEFELNLWYVEPETFSLFPVQLGDCTDVSGSGKTKSFPSWYVPAHERFVNNRAIEPLLQPSSPKSFSPDQTGEIGLASLGFLEADKTECTNIFASDKLLDLPLLSNSEDKEERQAESERFSLFSDEARKFGVTSFEYVRRIFGPLEIVKVGMLELDEIQNRPGEDRFSKNQEGCSKKRFSEFLGMQETAKDELIHICGTEGIGYCCDFSNKYDD